MKPLIPFVSRVIETEQTNWLMALAKAMPDVTLRRFCELSEAERQEARVAIVANPDPSEIAALPNLVWVQSLWAGVERLVSELSDASFRIVRMTDPQLAKTMAEAVLAWTLYLHRDMPRYHAQQTERKWIRHDLPLPQERQIGILGLGHLGRTAAEALTAQGFPVLGWSRTKQSLEGVTTLSGEDGLSTLLSGADIVICLLPLTDATFGLMNEDRFKAMRMGARFINFARGPIIEDAALIAALDKGHLDHAVLDVFDVEPLPEDHAFWGHPRITVLPHISAPTNLNTASKIVADNIENYIKTGAIPDGVDLKQGY